MDIFGGGHHSAYHTDLVTSSCPLCPIAHFYLIQGHTSHFSTPGPLHMLVLLPGMRFFPLVFLGLTLRCWLKCHLSERSP